jgi:hypothetical protein
LVTIEIIDGVKVAQERIANQKEVLVLTREAALVDDKVALAFVAFVKVLFGVNLENVVAHLESYWLNFGSNILARLFDVTESLIAFAIKLWKGSRPLVLNLIENIRRN